MALEPALIEAIGGALERLLAEGKKLLPEIRRQYPGLRFSQCDAVDMTDEPFCKGKGFDLYLVDGSHTCLYLTHDLAQATGLVVATP